MVASQTEAIKIRVTDTIATLLIKAAAHELHNANIYATAANHLSVRGFTNSASFMFKQIEEEQEHFKKVWNYIQDRNCKANILNIEAIMDDFSDLILAFSKTLEVEFSTTKIYNELLFEALDENDGITVNFAHEMLSIQKNEEEEFMTINDELALIGTNTSDQKLWDSGRKW